MKKNDHIQKEEVLKYKNDLVINVFLRDNDFKRSEAEAIFKETLKYLWISSYLQYEKKFRSDDNKLPSYIPLSGMLLVIDKMWHSFILCTRAYTDFCNKYFGRYIHHDPVYRDNSPSVLSKERLDEIEEELKIVYSYIYDKLGEETLEKWVEKIPKKIYI